MVPISELHKQHQELAALCEVLLPLLESESACKTSVFRELYGRLAEGVRQHLMLEDQTLYPLLIKSTNPEIKHAADNFYSSSRELGRVFSDFLKHQRKRKDRDHESFAVEAKSIITLLVKRIGVEESEFLPRLDELGA